MNTEYEKRLGKHIRFLRKKKKLTQEQLAARCQVAGCDITRSTIAKIEVGQRHIYADEIVLLCSILYVTYEDFFIWMQIICAKLTFEKESEKFEKSLDKPEKVW